MFVDKPRLLRAEDPARGEDFSLVLPEEPYDADCLAARLPGTLGRSGSGCRRVRGGAEPGGGGERAVLGDRAVLIRRHRRSVALAGRHAKHRRDDAHRGQADLLHPGKQPDPRRRRDDARLDRRLPARQLRRAVSEAAHRPRQAAAPPGRGRRAPDRAKDREAGLVGAHCHRGAAPRRHRSLARALHGLASHHGSSSIHRGNVNPGSIARYADRTGNILRTKRTLPVAGLCARPCYDMLS